jgi:hypothetical protein
MKISAKFTATKSDFGGTAQDRCRFDRKIAHYASLPQRLNLNFKTRDELNLDKLSAMIEFRSVKFIVIPNLKLRVNFAALPACLRVCLVLRLPKF